MIYVMGGNGFVGSAYCRLFTGLNLPHKVITHENFESLRHTQCDILINANGNSRKFLSDKEPMRDFDMSVRSTAASLHDIRSNHYVFLSSGDVYPDTGSPVTTDEAQEIDLPAASRYGRHKRLAEMLVQMEHPSWLVLRMGGFVGPGLKKNAIFDLMTDMPLWLTPDSALQFVSTDRAAAMVWKLISAGVHGEIVNLGARGTIEVGTVKTWLNASSPVAAEAKHVRYELALGKLARLLDDELPDSAEEVRDFLSVEKKLP